MRGWTAGLLIAIVSAGCGTRDLPDAFPTTLERVTQILENPNINAMEKRARLEQLGLSPEVVNGLLRDESRANQFGGDLASAIEKIAAGRFADLTPDEIQIYADAAASAPGGTPVTLSDTQAGIMTSFLRANGLNNVDQLQAFLDDPTKEVPSTLPQGALEDLFIDVDPNDVRGQL